MKSFRPIALLLACTALLSGCGQRGPLFLPEAEPPAAPAPASPADDEDERNEADG